MALVLSHQEFGSSVKPISTKEVGGGADYAHQITAYRSGFENLTKSLSTVFIALMDLLKLGLSWVITHTQLRLAYRSV